MLLVTHDSADDRIVFYLNGSEEINTTSSSSNLPSSETICIGSDIASKVVDQLMQHCNFRSDVVSADWVSFMDGQYRDNENAYSSWAWSGDEPEEVIIVETPMFFRWI